MIRRALRRLALLVAGLGFTAALASPLRAQVGSSTDIIIGRVIGPDSAPVAGARVLIVSVATQAQKQLLTRADGRFTVLFRDGGGQYRLLVTFLGMRPANLTVQRQADEDRLQVTVYMSSNPQVLSTVQVRGRVNSAPAAASSAGGSERNLPTQLLERMPLNPGDLIATATLAPGVVALGATDSTRASFSVAGQPSTQNNISVDGMSFLFGTVPQDAVRATRIVLNAYDVSRGQFTGGQIATTTKSGTSLFQGTANFTGRPPATQFAGNRQDAFAQKYAQGLFSSGVGGPFGKSDRAFYFVAGEVETRADAALSLFTAHDPTLEKLGVHPDTLDRFYTAMNVAGASTPNLSPLDRTSRGGSGLARVDIDVGESHQVMLRADYRRSLQRGSRVQPLAIPNSGGTTNGTGWGGMGMLTSVLGAFINEARLYSSREHQLSEPYLRAPSGIVTAASEVNGRQQLASLQFGGSQFLPRELNTTLTEASNELSWLTEDGGHRLKLGLLLNRESSGVVGVSSHYGTFFYNSVADLQSGSPSFYARTLSGRVDPSGTTNGAIYLGDAWRYNSSLQLVYGVRIEGTRLDGSSNNPAASAAFGREVGNYPTEIHASPRLGVTYLIGNVAGVPTGTFRAGIGEFRGRVPSQIVGYVTQNSGVSTHRQIVCVGTAVPTPTWTTYFTDSTSIPTSCAGGGSGGGLGSSVPNVAMFGDAFGAPRVWRASMALGKRVFTTYGLGIDALYAYGVHNPHAMDLNLQAAPAFSLGGSDARPVFALKQAIVQSTGQVALAASRVNPQYGTAFELGAGARSRTAQVTTQLTGGGKSFGPMTVGFFSLGYTFMRAEDESNGYPFGNAFATTAGDPRTTEWGTSDLERRHNLIGTAFVVFPRSLELSVIARALSGTRYTPMVNGDVNGDGVRNDRAFVYAGNPDTAVANGMQRLLSRADGRARDCLSRQLGTIAARNSCTTPWFPGLDLQLNWRPAKARLDRRVTLSLVAANVLSGVDQLVHGSRVKGWGQPTFPDRFLLTVRGFDSSAAGGARFLYQVNEHFGSPSGASNPFRIPFQLGVQIHATLGADPQREALKSVYGTPDGKPPAIKDLKARIYMNFPLPIKMALTLADSLKLELTPAQLARLNALNDSVNVQADTLVGTIAEVLSKAGSNPDPGAIAPKLQRSQTEALRIIQKSATDLKAVLTPEQWAKLPDRIRFPLQQPAQVRPPQRPPS
jgi:hypothetical protein